MKIIRVKRRIIKKIFVAIACPHRSRSDHQSRRNPSIHQVCSTIGWLSAVHIDDPAAVENHHSRTGKLRIPHTMRIIKNANLKRPFVYRFSLMRTSAHRKMRTA